MKRDDFNGGSFQFSLRTFLLFSLIISGPFVIIGIDIAKVQRQEAAIQTLRQRGVALFNFHKDGRQGRVRRAHFEGQQFADVDMATLEAFEHLEYLDLHDASVTGDGLKHLSKLANLMSVELNGTPVRG